VDTSYVRKIHEGTSLRSTRDGYRVLCDGCAKAKKNDHGAKSPVRKGYGCAVVSVTLIILIVVLVGIVAAISGANPPTFRN
jgi:hypothetical protein